MKYMRWIFIALGICAVLGGGAFWHMHEGFLQEQIQGQQALIDERAKKIMNLESLMVQYAPPVVLQAYRMSNSETGENSAPGAPVAKGNSDGATQLSFDVPPIVVDTLAYQPNNGRVYVKLQNVSTKTVDAIELAILSFDNMGRPAMVIKKQFESNVEEPLLLQGNVAPQGYMEGNLYVYTRNRGTKGAIVVKSIHYTDGSLWENNQYQAEINAKKEKL